MAACLWAGPAAAASHRAAGRLWGLEGVGPGHIEITVPRSKPSPIPLLVVHQSRLLRADLAEVALIPVTDVARTLIDLASILSSDRLEAALESALSRGLTRLTRLRWRLSQTPSRGKDGVRHLRRLLDERGPSAAALESPLEAKLERIIRRSNLPRPDRQVRVMDGNRFIARVDFAYCAIKVAIEADSFRHHGTASSWWKDRRRDKELGRLGWTMLRFTSDDLEHPDRVVAEIWDALAPRLFT